MKVTNATNSSNISRELRLPIIKKGGGNASVILKPGEFVYIEERANNSQLRMYEHKRMVNVTEEEKPEKLEYYKVYNSIDLLALAGEDVQNAREALREAVINDERLPKKLKDEFLKMDDEVEGGSEIEIEVQVPEDSIKEDESQKNKGGRPKGSKNKSKRGRPKKKGKPGRPKKRGPKPKSRKAKK
jgi:hypothetical protein